MMVTLLEVVMIAAFLVFVAVIVAFLLRRE